MLTKSGVDSAGHVSSWRQVVVGPALQKWYLYCVFEHVEPYDAALPNYIIGFRLGFQPLMMVDALRMVLLKAAEWGRPVFVAQSDVEAAFESLDHADILAGWHRLQVPTVLITAMYREVLGTSVQVVIAGQRANLDDMQDLFEGGRPGDVATPRHWN
eukprot:3507834-Karenia_brevis.AAC.1